MKPLIAGIVLLLALATCAGSQGTSKPVEPAPAAEAAPSSGDGSAELACSSFQSVSLDASRGVLTAQELREGLQGVYDDARYSDTPGISSGATRLLRSATSGSPDPQAIAEFGDACDEAGF